MKAPKDQSELRSFLGMVNYFSNFFPQMSLNDLLKKDSKWNWSATVEAAFELLKRQLTSLPVLAKYDTSLPLGLSCDASEKGVGACMFHVGEGGKEYPIAYTSKSLTKSERKITHKSKEKRYQLSLEHKFCHYLLGRKFVLQTDHRPLLAIFDSTKVTVPTRTSGRLARWALQLSQFDYEIQYRQSTEHGNADCLSRLPIGPDEKFDQANETEDQSERYIAAMEHQFIKNGPIQYHQVQKYTEKDNTLICLTPSFNECHRSSFLRRLHCTFQLSLVGRSGVTIAKAFSVLVTPGSSPRLEYNRATPLVRCFSP